MNDKFKRIWFKSVQFSRLVVSDSLRPHGQQHARPPCPSPTPRVYSNSWILMVMPSNHLILCHPLLLLPSIFPSVRVFSNKSVLCIRWFYTVIILCILFFNLFFNWRIIALQHSVVFCHTSIRISHRYIHVPSLPNLPSISLPILLF